MGTSGAQGGSALDAAKIEAAYVGYHRTFHNRLKLVEPMYEKLCTVIDDDAPVRVEQWLSSNPVLRKWIGEKVAIKFRGENLTIRLEPWEATIEVPLKDIRRDKFDLYSERIGSLADGYHDGIDDLVIDYLVGGVLGTSYGTTYDGQNLIDTDHTFLSRGGTSQSNKVTGALDATWLATAWQRYLRMVDEFGRPIRVRPKYLVVGPLNRDAGRKLVEQGIKANGEENIDKGSLTLIVHPRIVPTTDGNPTANGLETFLLPEKSSAVLVQRTAGRNPALLRNDNPEGDRAFDTGKARYGIECEIGSQYGLWQEIVGGPGA